jgi:hyperosmotically inducible protein
MKRSFFVTGLALVLMASLAAPAPARSPAQTNELEEAVVKALLSLPHYGVYDNLYFQASGSDVTLMGQALLEITKAEAGKRVARIKGIGKVTNQIEILPLSPSDDALRFSVYRAIFGSADLHRYSMGPDPTIHIIVKGGHVILVGMVSTDQDKQRAEMVAKSLPGIMSFKNDLRVEKK